MGSTLGMFLFILEHSELEVRTLIFELQVVILCAHFCIQIVEHFFSYFVLRGKCKRAPKKETLGNS